MFLQLHAISVLLRQIRQLQQGARNEHHNTRSKEKQRKPFHLMIVGQFSSDFAKWVNWLAGYSVSLPCWQFFSGKETCFFLGGKFLTAALKYLNSKTWRKKLLQTSFVKICFLCPSFLCLCLHAHKLCTIDLHFSAISTLSCAASSAVLRLVEDWPFHWQHATH